MLLIIFQLIFEHINQNNNIMAKTNSKSSNKSTSNRPKPLIPKAGYTKSGRRTYGNGGKV